MFQIKFCGITTVEDAFNAVNAGADAIGLNCYSGSKRNVSRETLSAISQAIGPKALRVGVFVNHDISDLASLVREAPLDAIQLHGDEDRAYLSKLRSAIGSTPVIRAFRPSGANDRGFDDFREAARKEGIQLIGGILDAFVPGEYGGSGTTANWSLASDLIRRSDLPIALAGGLVPSNVAGAILQTRAKGVDVASGVETAPGKKNRDLMEEFVRSAKSALQIAKDS